MADRKIVNVKIKSGTFYLSSKEDEGQGWMREEFQNPQNKEETLVRFHKKVTVEGYLNHLEIGEDKFKGKVLKMLVGGETESFSLSVPIMDTQGSVNKTNDYFNSLVGALENVKKGDKITMFVNNKNKNKQDRLYKNIVTLDSDSKLIKSNFSFSDVPKWESTETKDDFGETKVTWNASPTNKFYIDKIKKVVENFGEATTDTTVVESSSTSTQAETPVEMPNSDLPF